MFPAVPLFAQQEGDLLQVRAGAYVPAGLTLRGAYTFTGALTFQGTGSYSALQTFSAGLTVSAGTTAVQAITCTTVTASSLTSGRVPFAGTAGLLGDDAGLTYVGGAVPSLQFGSDAVPASGATSQMIINGAASSTRRIVVRTAGGNRWRMEFGGTESGSDAGLDYNMYACTDAGAIIDAPISVVRAAGGAITLVRPVVASALLTNTASGVFGAAALLASERLRVTGGTITTPGVADVTIGGGAVKIGATTASASTTTGALTVAGGLGVAGQITFDGTTGLSLRVTNGTANAAVATTLGSVGPTGSTAGNPQGWLRISVAGTDRFIPYW